MSLYETIEQKVILWRNSHYSQEQFPAIREILEWATNPETSVFR
jgi:hypothetical protein